MNCDEKPQPLWHALLLAVAPIVAGVAGEMMKEYLAHRRELRAAKPSARPS